jgi:TRAP-type C4-dicarboxylate transport system permease small subunit
MLLYQWVVFLGTALGVQRLRHFSIELLVRHLSPGARRAVDLLTPIAMAVVALVMIVQGWAILGINRNRIYATMDLSYVWAFLPIPLAGVLILIYVVQLEVRRLRGGPPTEGGHGR